MSQRDRRQKIRALLDSPIEGERLAAAAALARAQEAPEEKPASGSPEWHAAVQQWGGKLDYCVSNLGSPILSPSDIVLIRNWSRYRGDPWQPGAPDILKIYGRLKEENEQKPLLGTL